MPYAPTSDTDALANSALPKVIVTSVTTAEISRSSGYGKASETGESPVLMYGLGADGIGVAASFLEFLITSSRPQILPPFGDYNSPTTLP